VGGEGVVYKLKSRGRVSEQKTISKNKKVFLQQNQIEF
jgi:hypothetical protein